MSLSRPLLSHDSTVRISTLSRSNRRGLQYTRQFEYRHLCRTTSLLWEFFFLFRFYFVAFVDDLYGAWLRIQVPHDGLSEARSCLKSSTELSFSESESFRRFDQNQSHLCFEIEGNEAHDSRFHIFIVCALFSEYFFSFDYFQFCLFLIF